MRTNFDELGMYECLPSGNSARICLGQVPVRSCPFLVLLIWLLLMTSLGGWIFVWEQDTPPLLQFPTPSNYQSHHQRGLRMNTTPSRPTLHKLSATAGAGDDVERLEAKKLSKEVNIPTQASSNIPAFPTKHALSGSVRNQVQQASKSSSNKTSGTIRTVAPLINSRGRSLTFICPDLHNGTAREIAAMIGSRQGQAVLFEVPGSLLLAKYPKNVHRLAHYVRRIGWWSRTITEVRAILRNHSETLRVADAFICAMPSSLCEGLLGLNKTVIFAPGLRFSYTRCSKALWKESIRVMQRAVKSLKPRHFVAAMSRYDAEYVKYFTGIDALPLYASAVGYVPQTTYHPKRSEVLIGPLALALGEVALRGGDSEFAKQLVARKEFKFVTARDLHRGTFTYEQVAQHPAAVILPYAVMSIGLTELYAMGIPLFVPSARLMKERPHLYPNDRTMTGLNKTYQYCGANHSIVPEQDPSSNHTFSPESLTPEAKFYWLQFADFYQWPHVTFFDSIPDLIAKLQVADLAKTHDLMMAEWRQRERRLDTVWQQIADGLDLEPGHVPASFFQNR